MPASFTDDSTKSTTLEFHNLSPRAVRLLWLDYDGEEQEYAVLEHDEFHCQGALLMVARAVRSILARDAAPGRAAAHAAGDTCCELPDRAASRSHVQHPPMDG
jgi:hypothetical protein